MSKKSMTCIYFRERMVGENPYKLSQKVACELTKSLDRQTIKNVTERCIESSQSFDM